MRISKFPFWEILVVCATLGIVATILMPALNKTISFRDTVMPPMRYQNMELQAVLQDLYGKIRKQRGSRTNYSEYFHWERNNLKKRRVWLDTQEEHTLRDIFQRIEKSAQIKFEYLERPYHPGDVGRFIIRDARQ